MVIVLIGILSVTTTAVISYAIRAIQLSGAADKLASDLRFARNMAQAAGVWYGVSIEANPTNTYSVYYTNGSVDTIESYPVKKQANFVINLSSDFSTLIETVSIEGGKKVEFDPLGTPYTDKNSITGISQEGVVTLIKSGVRKRVRIVPNTGRIYTQ
jgi:Tfp pilus assembly protein FimT